MLSKNHEQSKNFELLLNCQGGVPGLVSRGDN